MSREDPNENPGLSKSGTNPTRMFRPVEAEKDVEFLLVDVLPV
jgi:hypothetical protein